MARQNLNARQPAKNISAGPPSRKIMGPNGVMITEKLSPLWGKKMVAPDGDIVTVTLASGYTTRSLKNNDHGIQKLEEKLKAGFLMFAECPVATKRIAKQGPDDKACDGEFSDNKCCPHLDKVIADRRAAHRQAQAEYGRSFETQTDRLLAHVQRQAEASVAERPGGSPGKKAPIGG